MDGHGEIEELSHKLLGGYHRLRFAALIANLPVEFTTGELVAASHRAPTAVSKELKHFADAGMLRKQAHGRWLRLHTGFWVGCAGLLEAIEKDRGHLGPVATLADVRDRRRKSDSVDNG